MADQPRRRTKRGSDSQTPRRVSGAIDVSPQSVARYDDKGRVVGTAIRVVKRQHDPNWTRTRERASECRTLLAGDMAQILPQNFKLANADAFAADLPITYTRAADLLSLLLQKRCLITRYRSTGSARSNDMPGLS